MNWISYSVSLSFVSYFSNLDINVVVAGLESVEPSVHGP